MFSSGHDVADLLLVNLLQIVFYAIHTTMRSLLAVAIRIELWKASSGRTSTEYVRIVSVFGCLMCAEKRKLILFIMKLKIT